MKAAWPAKLTPNRVRETTESDRRQRGAGTTTSKTWHSPICHKHFSKGTSGTKATLFQKILLAALESSLKK